MTQNRSNIINNISKYIPKYIPKAIIFDWDNTLVDTWPIICHAINIALEKMGHKKWSEEKIKSRAHLSMRDYFPKLFGDKWQEAGQIYADDYLKNHLEKLNFLPDALKLINFLSLETNIDLFIISNKNGITLRKETDFLNISDKFIKITGAEDAKFDKPNPEVVNFTLKYKNPDKNLDPNKDLIWFVGDSLVDLQCAENSNCQSVLFGQNHQIPDEFFNKLSHKKDKKLLYFKNHQEIIDFLQK